MLYYRFIFFYITTYQLIIHYDLYKDYPEWTGDCDEQLAASQKIRKSQMITEQSGSIVALQ